MIKVSIRKLTAAGFLGFGLSALSLPAVADTLVASYGITRNITAGTTSSVDLGSVNTVQCALTRVWNASSTTQAGDCRLVQVGGQWRLWATVVSSGASVTCEAHCYQ
jgi:hypothetical protein